MFQQYPTNEELVFQSLQQRCVKPSKSIFDIKDQPEYWRLSDLAILYPNVFDIRHPVAQSAINKMNDLIIDTIPDFAALETRPIHILNIKETYNAYFPETNTIQTIKNGTNQHLSRVACEYLFRQRPGYSIQQAFFMYPNQTSDSLHDTISQIKFEQIRSQISGTSNLLSAIVNRAYGARQTSFAEAWSALWCALYGVRDMQILNDRYNLKSSPINYMHPRTFNLISSMLQEIETKFCNQNYYSINEVLESVRNIGLFTRARFAQYGTKPESELTNEDSYKIVARVRKERKKFWEQYFPLSLEQQR